MATTTKKKSKTLKTQKTTQSVAEFLKALPADRQRDCKTVSALMQKATGAKPAMWGASIVGFGQYRYTYASGHSGDWPLTSFAPRKKNLTLYIMSGFDRYAGLMQKLGKFKTGKCCLYIDSLADVDMQVLTELVQESVDCMKKTYPERS